MRLFSEKILSFDDQWRGNTAVTDSKLIVKNIVGSFLILILSLLVIVMLLFSNVLDLVHHAIYSQDIAGWMMVLANLLLLGFLTALPIAWLVQSLVDYRNNRDLTRLGMMTKGSIVDKWVDLSGSKPIYYVRYKYLAQFSTTQKVGEETFRQLKRDEKVFVLYLEHSPHISRLDLE